MKKTINRMDEFEIDEISSVDFPAQTSAQALLMKAREDEELAKRTRLVSVQKGHQHLIDMSGAHGETSYDSASDSEFSHSHPWVRNDDGSIEIGMADGHTHTVIEKRFTAEDLAKELDQPHEPAGSGGGQPTENPMTKTEQTATGADEAVEKRMDELEKRAVKAERLAELNDVQKAHYGTLSPQSQEDFLSSTPQERDVMVEKARGEDPVVYTTMTGREIRKSAGSLVLELAQQADENAKELAVEKAARQREVLTKRASEELSNLSGSEESKVDLLKSIDSLPSERRTAVLEILKGANEGVSKAFETAGTTQSPEAGVDAEAKLDELAKRRAETNGITFEKAYSEVLVTPEGRELYKESRRS